MKGVQQARSGGERKGWYRSQKKLASEPASAACGASSGEPSQVTCRRASENPRRVLDTWKPEWLCERRIRATRYGRLKSSRAPSEASTWLQSSEKKKTPVGPPPAGLTYVRTFTA